MKLSIRTWVLAAASVVLFPMALVFGLVLQHIKEDEKALIEAEVQYRTRELVHITAERLAVAVQALQTLTNSDAAHVGDWATLYQSAKRLIASNPNYAAVTLVDRHNELLFVTSLPYGEKAFNTSYVDLVGEVFRSGQPNVSGPFQTPISPHMLVAVSVPVFQGDEVSHVLRMILRTESINQLLKQIGLPEGWLAAVIDVNGTLVARSPDPGPYVGKPASESARAAIQRNDGQLYKGVALGGTPITAQVLPVFGGHWFAAVAVPDALLETRYRRSMWVLGGICLFITVGGFGVAAGIAHFFARQTLALEQVVGSNLHNAQLPRPLRIQELYNVYRSHQAVRVSEHQARRDLAVTTQEKDEVHDLYEHAPCGYHSIDPQGRIVRINQTELNWLGRTRNDVVGRPITDFFTDEGKALFKATLPQFLATGRADDLEFELVRPDGTLLPVMVSATLIRDDAGQPLMSRSTVYDMTERKKLERRLEELSNHDALTGLSNRRHFYELASQEIERATRLGSPLAVAMLDVDHFKRVNDQHGHATGDVVLKTLSATCRAVLRQVDVVARFGGEEFVLLLPHTGLETAISVLERLREVLSHKQVETTTGAPLGFTVSIGLTLMRPAESDVDAMLARADAALYEAKRLGRNQVRVST